MYNNSDFKDRNLFLRSPKQPCKMVNDSGIDRNDIFELIDEASHGSPFARHARNIPCNLPEKAATESNESRNTNDTTLKRSKSCVSDPDNAKNSSDNVGGWFTSWIWPFARNSETNSNEVSNLAKNCDDYVDVAGDNAVTTDPDDVISCHTFLQLKQELREKIVAMNMLNRKVSHLERMVKLKDKKIVDLSARVTNSDAKQERRSPLVRHSTSKLKTKSNSYHN